ncbi:MAG: translocation/assembly module TamB domain-containing protein [Solidesulfovibrio sp. DCME]|uniref:translocation/assembly module TamB domain-containing protein n=1 Tax=Solidesulfovibrio sp. DCME TaxID=3447380 RepID=UPI003D14E0FC
MPNSTSASDNPSSRTPPGRPAPGRRRRYGRLLALCCGGCAGLLVLVWLALLTPVGLGGAAFVAEKAIQAATGLTATIRDVSGTLPFSLRVGRFALADGKGAWLIVSDAHFAWSPLALLRGRVVINDLSADIVRLRRPPDLPPAKESPASLEWPPRFPRLPAILVDRLAVGRIILDAPVAGQDAVLSLAGRLAESGSGAVGLALDARRLDGDKPLTLRLGGALNYADWKLAVKAGLQDAPGGLLAAALAGPQAGALDVALTGDGSLASWKGTLAAKLADAPVLRADLGLAVPLEKNATAAFSLEAGLTPPAGLLPDALARLVGQAPTCRLAGRFGIVSGEFDLDRAELTAAAGTLAATAHLPADGKTLAGQVRVAVPDAAVLDPSLAGSLAVTGTASGAMDKPKLVTELSAKGFAAGPVRLATATLAATAEPAGSLDGAFPGAGLRLSGAIEGLAGPEGTSLLGQRLDLSLEAAVDGSGAVTSGSGRIVGPGGAIRLANLRYAGESLSGDLDLTLADVAGAASLAGLRLTGGLTLAAAVTADAAGQGKARARLGLTGLASPTGGPRDPLGQVLAALLGPAPTLSLDAAFSPKGATVDDLKLTGKALSLAGSARFDAPGETLAAKLALAAPDLAVLGPALEAKAGGTFSCDIEASGKAASPRVVVKATADKLVFDDLALAGATIEGTVDDLAGNASGKLALAARREGETARLDTAIALAGNRLAIKDLRLAAPEAAFTGEATIALDSGRVSGKLSGNAANLAGLGRFTGQHLAGSLKLALTAEAARDGQRLTCDLTAANLAVPGVSATRLTVAADLANATATPRGKATVSGSGLAVGGLNLAGLNLTASGDGKALAASLEAKGTIPGEKALEVAAKLSLATAGKAQKITVTALSGSLDKRRFALAAPAVVGLEGDNVSLGSLALSFDKAKIEASGNLSGRAVAAKATVSGLPLPLLASFGLAGVGGTATATATVSGPPQRPEVAVEARVDGLVLAAEKSKDLPSLAVRAKAAIGGGKASVTATIAPTGKKEAVTLEAALPVRFALSPFAWDMPASGALSGRITADSDLSQMAVLLAQANTRIDGRLSADMRLGGTLAAPSVSGNLALAAKSLENADAGLVLRNVTMRAEAAGGVLTVSQAGGQDGRGGSFSLSGTVGVADLSNGPVDLALTLTRLRVAGLDLATVTADGKVTVTGTLSRLRAGGTITLGPADINLPTSMPPEVTVIPVTYVNDPNAPKKKGKAAPPAAARHIDLDVTVALGQAVYVRGLGLESRWGGQVAVTGTAAAPKVVGKFSVEKGRVELFGSNLDIAKGEIVFHGENPPAPVIDILAENTTNDVMAGVAITGDATNPSINLVSQPTLSHDDILARILFGQSAANLSPLQAAQLAQAAASLYAGGTPTSLLARTRRILGLDQLTLVSGKGGISSTVLKAGKEIVKGVTVGVEQGMGAQTGAVSVEVQVTPNITIDSRVGANNKQGVGVNWKWDY